ncbi:16S rRNA (cytosine(1402)-N(4))-methyltransferase RsmH [Candidatus Bipolaricaulota bacterium]|nr:16S rRNA (cytosine(1402)-N(4))-methyltransferase RsmH [Candidatus Bipolaricaulota bacterium]
MTQDAPIHQPVLADDVVRLLEEVPGGWVVDGTVGLGGHSEALLLSNPGLRIVGIDRDEQALGLAAERLAGFGERVRLVHGNYRDLDRHLDDLGIARVGGVLLDVGVSSLQLDRPDRGFSFRADAPLDMRMDRSSGPTASEWLLTTSEQGIVRVLREYGEERYAGRIAKAIIVALNAGPIESTGALVKIVHRAVPGAYFGQKIDPATRTFQALRIAVNDELAALRDGLAAGFARLSIGGVLCVISFHSLEDRIVKQFLREKAASCVCPPDFPECLCDKRVEAEILTKRPIVASADEIERNARARSAKLRAARRVV